MGFGFRRPPQHPGLAMWGSGPGALHCILGSGWQKEKAEVEQREEGEGRREGGKEGRKEGVAPLLKSRDPHLAGGEKWDVYPRGMISLTYIYIMGTFTKQIGFDSQKWGC